MYTCVDVLDEVTRELRSHGRYTGVDVFEGVTKELRCHGMYTGVDVFDEGSQCIWVDVLHEDLFLSCLANVAREHRKEIVGRCAEHNAVSRDLASTGHEHNVTQLPHKQFNTHDA